MAECEICRLIRWACEGAGGAVGGGRVVREPGKARGERCGEGERGGEQKWVGGKNEAERGCFIFEGNQK